MPSQSLKGKNGGLCTRQGPGELRLTEEREASSEAKEGSGGCAFARQKRDPDAELKVPLYITGNRLHSKADLF